MRKASSQRLDRPASIAPRRTRRERQALKASVERIADQAQSLGLLDPLDVEPAVVYIPETHEP